MLIPLKKTGPENARVFEATGPKGHPRLLPALSVEEAGLMTHLQSPPDAGPSVVQVTSGLQNWKCAGRRLVEIGGRLPTQASSVLCQNP